MSTESQNVKYGLSLSNELVCLLRKAEGDVWVPVTEVKTDDPDFEAKIAYLSSHVEKKFSKNPKVAIFIPFSEILFSFIKLPSDDPQAAHASAVEQLEKQTPYSADEISFDLILKSGRAVTPCATVAKATLQEAAEFAQTAGFVPSYYTAKRNAAVFPKEPIFHLEEQVQKTALPPIALWGTAAAAAIAIGVVSLWQFSPVNAKTEQASKVANVLPSVDTTVEIASSAPLLNSVEAPTSFATQAAFPDLGVVAALTADATKPIQTSEPTTVGIIKPIDSVFNEPVDTQDLVQVTYNSNADLTVTNSNPIPQPTLPIVTDLSENPLIWKDTSQKAEAPAEPILLAAVEPSVNGTLSPDGFSVYSGKPSVVPPSRGQTEIFLASLPPKPKLRPTSDGSTISDIDPNGTERIEDLVEDALATPTETDQPTSEAEAAVVDPLTPEQVSEPTAVEAEETGPDLLLQSNPELRAFKPRLRDGSSEEPTTAETTEETLPIETPTPDLATTEPLPEPETETETETALVEPETTSDEAIEEPTVDLLAIANPELRTVKPRLRSSEETPVVEEDINLLALANPALRSYRAPTRPNNLQVAPPKPDGLLALANPSLRGKKPNRRPSNLRITRVDPEVVKPVEPEVVKPVEPEIVPPTAAELEAERLRLELEKQQAEQRKQLQAEQERVRKQQLVEKERLNNLATSSRLAVRRSPVPAKKSSRFSRSVQKTEQNIRTARLTPDPKRTPTTTTKPSSKTTPKSKDSKFSKSKISLIGVYGTQSSRRALIRLPGGTYKRVKMGQRVSGWRVSAIGESTVRITKGSRNQTLRLP